MRRSSPIFGVVSGIVSLGILLALGIYVGFADDSSTLPGKQRYDDPLTLHASGAETVTGTGTVESYLPGGAQAIVCQLKVTAAATAVGDTLDVFIQTTVDGTNWLDVVAFTQVLGNGGALTHVAKIQAATAVATYEVGTALSAGAERDLIGSKWRARWVVVDADTDDASFTFSVTAIAM